MTYQPSQNLESETSRRVPTCGRWRIKRRLRRWWSIRIMCCRMTIAARTTRKWS